MPKTRQPWDKRNTAAFQQLARRVLAEERDCWLRLPGCTGKATTVDHVVPVSIQPQLQMMRSNCRGACSRCNSARGNKPINRLKSRAITPGVEWFL